MRVLLVHNFYKIPGGEDSVVRQELSLLRSRGIEVDLFSVTNDDIIGTWSNITTALQVPYNPGARRALSRKLMDFNPDVVHIHNFFPLLSPSILDACRDAGVPAVMTLHNFRILCPSALLLPDDADRERSLRQMCWWTVPRKVYRGSAAGTLAVAAMVELHKSLGTWQRKVDCFIALTGWAKAKLVEGGLPATRIVVKPNGVARSSHKAPVRRQGALFVGRLDRQKGVDVLLQAWRQIDLPLTIIGDGPLGDLVREQKSPSVTWLGRQSPEAVRDAMQAARFLVLPSVGFEMFPLTIVEAFASGLPVLCSDLPSLTSLVTPGVTGSTFRPGDADALAAEVSKAVAAPSSLDGWASRALAEFEDRYTEDANFDQLIGIYRSVRRVGAPDAAQGRAALTRPLRAGD